MKRKVGYDYIDDYADVPMSDELRAEINRLNDHEIYFWRKVRKHEYTGIRYDLPAGRQNIYNNTRTVNFFHSLNVMITDNIDLKIDIERAIKTYDTDNTDNIYYSIYELLLLGFTQQEISQILEYSQAYISNVTQTIKQIVADVFKEYYL